MKGLAVLLALVCTLALTSCATTQGEPDAIAMQPPQSQPPPAKLPSQASNKAQAQAANMCRPGFFFCPGKVMGCCPNGWGCASTHCIRPAGQIVERDVDKQAVDRQAVDKQGKQTVNRCAPGTYFCPGRVNGCCPNGWGCASTHCVRPAGQRDL